MRGNFVSTNQNHYLDLGSDVISMEFLRSLLRRHFARAQVATLRNVDFSQARMLIASNALYSRHPPANPHPPTGSCTLYFKKSKSVYPGISYYRLLSSSPTHFQALPQLLQRLPFTRDLYNESLDEKLSFGGCQSSPPPVKLPVLTPLSTQFSKLSNTF